MANILYQEEFFLIFPTNFIQQPAWNDPTPDEDIGMRLALTNPLPPVRERTRETIFDCDGAHIVRERINSELARWTIAVQSTPRIAAGFKALAKGAMSSFSGSAVNVIQTLTIDVGTTGKFKLANTYEGRAGKTEFIEIGMTNPEIQAILDRMERPVEAGDLVVSGSWATGIILTGASGGKLSFAPLPLFTIEDDDLTGGDVEITLTVAGSNKLSTITKSSGRNLALITFHTGYEGKPETYKKHKNFAVNKVTIRIVKHEISSVEIELIGDSRTLAVGDEWDVPACVIPDPVRSEDCRLEVGNAWMTGDLREMTQVVDNQMITDNDARPWDSIYLGMAKRGRQCIETYTLKFDGGPADNAYIWADQELEKPIKMHYGSPKQRLTTVAPTVGLKLDQPDITYTNQGESIINITGQPHKDPTLLTYSKDEYRANETVPFLGT